MQLEYAVFQELRRIADSGTFLTYGIRVWRREGGGKLLLRQVSDVSVSRPFVERIAALCNRYERAPEHLMDVIEDAFGK